MSSQQFRKLGRSLLAASAVGLGVASLGAQTDQPAPASAAPPAAPASTGINPSRVDIFLGYSYFGPHGTLKPLGTSYSSIDLGAIGSGAFYFNKYVGAELLFSAHPDGNNDGLYLPQAGVIFRAPMDYFSIFAHGLAGSDRLAGPNNEGPLYFHNPYTWGTSLAAGGGLDYYAGKHFAIRLFQADYVYTHNSFGPYTPPPGGIGGRANLNSARLSAGIVMKFGSIVPPPPVTYSCVVSPTSVYAGDPITVTGTALNLDPKKTATYTWSADSGKITGTSNVANLDTAGLNAGTYNVKGHVSEGNKPGQMADCTVPFTVNPPAPPTISCSASPSTVAPGDSSTITSTANSPQGRPLTYSYSATSGSISGTTSTATLSTVGAAPGTITVTCNVTDDKGQSASATTTVSINAPAPPPAPSTSQLCSISFDRDKKRPARVDNEAKACLDDVALNLQRSSDSKVAVVGNGSGKLGAQRAINTKDYLVKEKGIDASRVSVYTGTGSDNTVTNTLIPAGATAGDLGAPVDETTMKAIPRSAPAARHHHRRHSK